MKNNRAQIKGIYAKTEATETVWVPSFFPLCSSELYPFERALKVSEATIFKFISSSIYIHLFIHLLIWVCVCVHPHVCAITFIQMFADIL